MFGEVKIIREIIINARSNINTHAVTWLCRVVINQSDLLTACVLTPQVNRFCHF